MAVPAVFPSVFGVEKKSHTLHSTHNSGQTWSLLSGGWSESSKHLMGLTCHGLALLEKSRAGLGLGKQELRSLAYGMSSICLKRPGKILSGTRLCSPSHLETAKGEQHASMFCEGSCLGWCLLLWGLAWSAPRIKLLALAAWAVSQGKVQVVCFLMLRLDHLGSFPPICNLSLKLENLHIAFCCPCTWLFCPSSGWRR